MHHQEILPIFVGKRDIRVLFIKSLSVNYSPKNITKRMKKLFRNYRLPMLTALSGSLLVLGCTNADYDFDKVDYTLGFGGGEITLPGNNSTKDILLDDLLDISTSDLITTDANGDYKLYKEPDNAIEPVEVNIERITIASHNESELEYPTITLPDIPNAVRELFPGPVSLPFHYETGIPGIESIDIPVLEANGDISLLEYEFDADPAIKSSEYVEVGENGQGVNLTLDLTIPSPITKFGFVKIDLPDMLTMTCPSKANYFDTKSNTLTLTNCSSNEVKHIVFNVTRINVKTIDENNFVKLENGKFMLKSTVKLGIAISELTLPNEPTITLSGVARFDDMVITEARGKFDPEINLDDVGTVNINSLPDFLTEEEVVADIDNPQIWLTLSSTMPLGGTINAQLTSDTHPTPIKLSPIEVAASADGITPVLTRIVICRHAPTDLAGYTPMIVPNLSELIEKLKEPMEIKFTVTSAKADSETPANIKLGHSYRLAPEYKFECPLAFGDKAIIVYTETENDWNKDIDKLNLSQGGYVHVTATAVNRIPADLVLEITPLDKNGQTLSAVNVDLIKKDVAGTKDASLESPIEAKISGDISSLDGVSLKLKAKSNEQLRGVTLNKTSQTLKLKDLSVKLVGKVIYDAN